MSGVNEVSIPKPACDKCGNENWNKPRIQVTAEGLLRLYATCTSCGKSMRLPYRVFVDDNVTGKLCLVDSLFEDRIN